MSKILACEICEHIFRKHESESLNMSCRICGRSSLCESCIVEMGDVSLISGTGYFCITCLNKLEKK